LKNGPRMISNFDAAETDGGDPGRRSSEFARRHIGPSPQEIEEMLGAVEADSLEDLARETIPASLWMEEDLRLPRRYRREGICRQLGRRHDRSNPRRAIRSLNPLA